MDWTLEVVVIPVSDIDRSIAFYRDQVGFALDHDTITPQMHVTQLTPVGSGCSIVFGDGPGMQAMEPGSMRGLQLVVADAAVAREELLSRGVEASEMAAPSSDSLTPTAIPGPCNRSRRVPRNRSSRLSGEGGLAASQSARGRPASHR